MKAEERKEIQTNSLIHTVQRLRERLTGRTLYYLIGTAALVVGALLLYRYLTGERSKTRDAALLQLVYADTREKLKQGMEDHRGTAVGSMFKLHLARDLHQDEGLLRLGTDNSETRRQAAASLQEARTYWLDLTGEFRQHDQTDLVQVAWHGAAEAEEALVGLPTADGGNDSRGNVDKVIEYYENAAAIFPDTEFSKRDREKGEKIKANKEQFVATQKAIYKPREKSPFGPPPKSDDPFASLLPRKDPGLPKIEPPPAPPGGKADVPPAGTTPAVPPPAPPPTADPKKTTTPDPKPAEAPKADPKAK
jgi:hypothetical protein